MSDESSETRARARVEEFRAKGKAVADYLNADDRCFQTEAALKVGISEGQYFEWMSSQSEWHLAFQAEVLPALYAQARKNEDAAERDIFGGEQHSSAAVTWHKWKLEKRYRKLFGDLAQKVDVEVSGKGGGPIPVVVLPSNGREPDAE